MSAGKTTDRWVVAMLVLGGVLLAAFGVRTWMLERDHAKRRGLERARAWLATVAKDASSRAQLHPDDPVASWVIDGAPLPPTPSSLGLREAQHLLARGDATAALRVLRSLIDAGNGPEGFVAARRAAVLAKSQGDVDRAYRYWQRAAAAPPTVYDGTLPVRTAAMYGMVHVEFDRPGASSTLASLLAACRGGLLLSERDLGVADLLVALADAAPKPARSSVEGERLASAAAMARDGQALLRRFPPNRRGVDGDTLVLRSDRTLRRMPFSAAVPKGAPVQIRSRTAPVPNGYVVRPLPAPLHALRAQTPVRTDGGPGGWRLAGMVAGFVVYVLGALFAVGALRRGTPHRTHAKRLRRGGLARTQDPDCVGPCHGRVAG